MSLGTGSHFNLDQIRPIDDEQYLKDNMLKSGYFPFRPDLLKDFLKDDTAAEFERICRDYAWDCFQEYRVHDRFCDQKMLFINFNWHRRKMAVLDALKYYFHCVLPLLDYDLFDLSLSIPPEWKIGNQLYIELYKRHFPELAAIPWTKTGRNLYASETQIQRTAKTRQAKRRLAYIVRRLSHGHINIRDNQAIAHWEPWLRTQPGVRDVVLPIVRSACDRVPDFFDGAKISRLLDEYDKGKYWHFPTIKRVFNFADWYALFVDDEYRELIS
ncbi:MAG: hypothetical protein J7M12_01300, partial [Candidatus Hydrogenedentes bacterium]|nr:hypothetical protein [Candidatus Hydrogenedentota bacterium]